MLPMLVMRLALPLIFRTTIAKACYTAKVHSPLFFSFMCLVVIGINVAALEFYRSDKTYDLKLSRQWMQATLVLTTLGYQSSFENQVYSNFILISNTRLIYLMNLAVDLAFYAVGYKLL
ncbi:uncharacterized protein LOC111405703 [Olea europaea var. sylvestris]|uniref:uncharacterized protein LOC111405703 n=1 Tax=Olea europaea var. sylvestris TaxID=158386 RepID=UPI000C1D0602|nr:uncharacterized protein LOC111405703 [Olea europaea var. sylvestris]